MKAVMMLVIISLFIAGCSTAPVHDDPPQMANPASVNCLEKGGSLQLVDDGSGGQLGMCTLEDGTVCEEWAYMRGECPAEQVACTADAKLCPDGSAVGRTGPDCEFAPCPDERVACREDAKVCPDGSAVGRLPPDCEFPACPGEDTTGYLEGKISIGPICPVESYPPDPDCQPSKATFDAWKVGVFKDGTKVAELDPDESGNYNLALEAGRYKLDFLKKQGIGGSALPLDITIRAKGTTTMNIEVDTGIR